MKVEVKRNWIMRVFVFKNINIMKYLLLLLGSISFLGCREQRQEVESTPDEIIENTTYGRIKIITLDGCEYIVYSDYNKGGITHKANCKNHN